MTAEHPPRVNELVESLKNPRAASAYGIDTRELRHNAFFHFLICSKVGETLLQEIAKELTQKSGAEHHWQLLADEKAVIKKADCNRSGGAGRPDERIECTVGSEKQCVLLVEMKLRAPGGGSQLEDYMSQEANSSPGSTVVGLLLRIPGKDRLTGCTHPQLNGQMFASCIEAAMRDRGDELPEEASWLVRDYLATLRFLDLLDETIVAEGQWLSDFYYAKSRLDGDGPLRQWLNENWSWVCVRIVREVDYLIAKTNKDWYPSAYGERDTANVEMEPESLKLHLDASDDAPGASLYFQWKLGVGLDLRSAVRHYQSPPPKEVMAIEVQLMNELCEKARNILPSAWQHRGRTGRSRMVARLANTSHDVNTIVVTIQQEVEPLIGPLTSVVEEQRKVERKPP